METASLANSEENLIDDFLGILRKIRCPSSFMRVKELTDLG